MLNVSRLMAAASLAASITLAQAATESRPWPTIVAAAKGQTVDWNACGGDDRTNAFIAWAGGEVKRRYRITIEQVRSSWATPPRRSPEQSVRRHRPQAL